LLTGGDGLQHLWEGDEVSGLCRFDPTGTTFTKDPSSCVLAFGGSPQVKPGQLSFDGHYIYMPDLSAKSTGVGKLGYVATANGGKGGLSIFDRGVIAPTCGLAGNIPWGTALGPDGNLYVSFKKSPNITRIVNPGAFSGSCADVQNIGIAGDGRKSFALAFAGPNLWETNNNGIGVIPNAALVTTQVQSSETFLVAGAFGLSSDANGVVYEGNTTDLQAFDGINGSSPVTVATGFSLVQGVAVDPTSVGLPGTLAGRVFVADDPTGGLNPGNGRTWLATLP
jgi:hypothetical protein